MACQLFKKYMAALILGLSLFFTFLVVASGSLANPNPEQGSLFEIGSVLNNIDLESVTAADIDSALPRLTGERMILRLRGDDVHFAMPIAVQEEDSLKKALIMGASFTASQWEWELHFKRRLGGDWRFAVEQNLSSTNHLLKSLGASYSLLVQIDVLKSRFEASRDSLEECQRISTTFDEVEQAVRGFLENDAWQSFQSGRWLVHEAYLSALCLRTTQKCQKYVVAQMNSMPNRSEEVAQLIRKILTPKDEELRQLLAEKVEQLTGTFYVQNLDHVRQVKTLIHDIFELCEIRFPSLAL